MARKQNDQDFEVINSPEQTLIGDANKIKLKMVSYATILEVERNFLEEQVNLSKENLDELTGQLDNPDLDKNQKIDLSVEIAKAAKEFDNLKSTMDRFREKQEKYMDFARKALRMPNSNFEELEKNGVTVFEDKTIKKEELEQKMTSMFESAQTELNKEKDGEVIFDSVDSEAIKDAVNEAINDQTKDKAGKTASDYINNVNDKNIDKLVAKTSESIKDSLDEPASIDRLNDIFLGSDTQSVYEDSKPIPIIDKYDPYYDSFTVPLSSNKGKAKSKSPKKGSFASLSDEIDFTSDETMEASVTSRCDDLKNGIQELKNEAVHINQEEIETKRQLKETGDEKKRYDLRIKYLKEAMPQLKQLENEYAKQEAENQRRREAINKMKGETAALQSGLEESRNEYYELIASIKEQTGTRRK